MQPAQERVHFSVNCFFFSFVCVRLPRFQLAINYCFGWICSPCAMMNFVFIYLWGLHSFSQWIWLLPHYVLWFALLHTAVFQYSVVGLLLLWLFIWLLNKIWCVCVWLRIVCGSMMYFKDISAVKSAFWNKLTDFFFSWVLCRDLCHCF